MPLGIYNHPSGLIANTFSYQRSLVDFYYRQIGLGHQAKLRIHLDRSGPKQSAFWHHVAMHVHLHCFSHYRRRGNCNGLHGSWY